MPEENVDPVSREKAKLFRNLNQLLALAVLALVLWGVFGYDFKTCRACSGIGRLIVACSWCDGDGKVSFWKAWRQAPTGASSTAPASTTSEPWSTCPHRVQRKLCRACTP
jgi:hypothetical protein